MRTHLLRYICDTVKLVSGVASVVSDGGWDFERFDDLSKAILELFKIFRRQRVPDEQVMIDFTGGQKVTSVVAAAVTFNRRSKAQYVQTNKPWNVVSYDVMMASSDTGVSV